MVKQRIKILAPVLIVLLFMLAVGTPALAAGGPRVVDLANVLSPADESILEQKAAEIGARFNMDLVIVTTNDTGGRSAMDFADDYFDYNGYGVGDSRDGALFLIDFANRQTWISTSGDKTIEALTDAQIENILDDVYAGNKMSSGDYAGAAEAFLTSTQKVLQGNTFSLLDGLLGLITSGATGLGFFASTKSSYKGKPKPNIFEYRGNSIVSMGLVTDNLVNQFTTQRVIAVPTSNNNRPFGGGGSSTHTSSSGRTHGGGGRGF